MANAKTIYIWEGTDNIAITRGYEPESQVDDDMMRVLKIRHKGLFKPWTEIKNVNSLLFGSSKKLFSDNKVVDGWQVIRLKIDYKTLSPCLSDYPNNLMEKITSLKNEAEMWKAKYNQARLRLSGLGNYDIFRETMKKDFNFYKDIKNLTFGESGYGFNPLYSNRWGMGGAGMQQQQSQGDENI